MSWGVYAHVPWCQLHCPYCGFYVEVERARAPWEAFADRVVSEVAWRRARHRFEGAPDTVYLGGGTPSRMPAAVLHSLLDRLDWAADAEITIEANPEDVDSDWLTAAIDAGVTRVSLGVQTLDPARAKKLGRAASVREARIAMERLATSELHSWSADLMFALPHHTAKESPPAGLAADPFRVDRLADDLDALLAFEPPHVSLYGLTIEPGTGFERLRDRGALAEVEPEAWRAQHDLLFERLRASGRRRYEVSNFALPGHESRHNTLYWTDQPYLGVGPSAHGYGPARERWMNLADVHAWLTAEDPTLEEESFDPSRYAADLLISGMRGVDGVELARLRHVAGLVPDPDIVARLMGGGLLRPSPDRLALTENGVPVSDAVVRTLIEALTAVSPHA